MLRTFLELAEVCSTHSLVASLAAKFICKSIVSARSSFPGKEVTMKAALHTLTQGPLLGESLSDQGHK